MILHYFKKKENKVQKFANNIYTKVLVNSKLFLKENNFFKEKDYNSSFEVVSFNLIILIKINIFTKRDKYKYINDELVKLFISDLDESLRAKGIGDMSIGKYVKSYVKKFYFRLSKFPKDINAIDESNLLEYIKSLKFVEDNEIVPASKKFFEYYKKIIKYSN